MSSTDDGGEAPPPSSSASLSLELNKPLGMILEEVEENAPRGVMVGSLAEGGSAESSPDASKLVGMRIRTVMEEDVTGMSFDDVMDRIIDAPSPVLIEFDGGEDEEVETSATTASASAGPPAIEYDIGTPVTVTVLQDDKELLINA